MQKKNYLKKMPKQAPSKHISYGAQKMKHEEDDEHHFTQSHEDEEDDEQDETRAEYREDHRRHPIHAHNALLKQHALIERTSPSIYHRLRGEEFAKKADLEENILHYVLQYARIVSEILRVPRIREKDAERREKIEVDAFKQCIRRNVENAHKDSDKACCLREGLHFDACIDLSRKLLASLKELKSFLRNEAEKKHGRPDDVEFNDFLNRHLSNKEISKLYSIGRYLAEQLLMKAAIYLLLYAMGAGLFLQAAQLLGIPPSIIDSLQHIYKGADTLTKSAQKAAGDLLRPFLDKWTPEILMGIASALGTEVWYKLLNFFGMPLPSGSNQTAPILGLPVPKPAVMSTALTLYGQ